MVAVPAATGMPIGDYGAPGIQYRTESDSYARITTTGNQGGIPDRFKVELKSGIVREYRAVRVPALSGTLSSSIAPPAAAPGDAPLADAIVDFAQGELTTDRWVLERETDESGNRLTYVWSDQDADAINPTTHGIELRLKAIEYSHANDPTIFRKVTVEYEDRTDNGAFTWHLGVRNELRHRIRSITAHAPSPSRPVPVWTYLIEYSPTVSKGGRDLLTSVRRCGLASSSTAGEGHLGLGGCLWKKVFSWGDQKAGALVAPSFTSHTVKIFDNAITWPVFDAADPSNWANALTATTHPPVTHVLDLDGNGTDDLVMQASVGQDGLPTHIFRGQRLDNGTAMALSQYSFFDGAMQPNGRHDNVLLQTARAVDLDGDGKDELLTVRQLQNLDPYGNPGQGWTYENKLFGWREKGFGATDFAPLFGIYAVAPKRFNFVDLDGDNRLDMVVEGDGAESGTGAAFFWWNKTWDVWMNQGGTLVKTGSVPLETKCPSLISDADGDGRGELIQLYDHDEVVGKSDAGIPWATDSYDAGADLLGYKQYQCTAIGYLSANAAGKPMVTKNAQSLTAPIAGLAAARANAPIFGRHAVPDVAYGDFNGDGLEDEFSTQYDAVGQMLHAWVRWNSGNGYGPRQEVPNFFPSDVDVGWQVKQLVADMDGDGDDDIVSLRRPEGGGAGAALVIALSDGRGGFALAPQADGPGLFEAVETYNTTRIGDFDGDGRPDLVGFTDSQTLVVRLQDFQDNERLISVADEPTPWDSLTVVYSNQWSNKPEPVQACTYPLACLKRGATVVRRVLSREHLVDPSAAELSDANARTTEYSYEDRVMDLRGRGRTGFRKVRQWDSWRPVEVVKEYDNRTSVGNGYFPGVAMPVRVTMVVPFALAGGSGNEDSPDTTGPVKPTSMLAHVVQTTTVPQVQALNKASAGDTWGLTYDVHAQSWTTREWEQTVLIDWSAHTSEHLSSAAPNPPLYSGKEPVSLLRVQQGSAIYDDFGNAIHTENSVVGAQVVKSDSQFKNITQPGWQIGRLYSQTLTRSDGNAKTTRNTEFYYDLQGRLTDAYREKGNADPTIPATTHLDYDDRGNVVGVQVTALNDHNLLETRESRFEYAPAVAGWADERLYPSQVWSPGVAGYQPSSWIAVYPAYGVPVATMDANGIQTYTQFDDLGRVVSLQRDGGPVRTLHYEGRDDSGGFNGIVMKVLTQGKTMQVHSSDALGRTLLQGDRGFDGTMRYTQRRYDLMSRLKSLSRPYADGSQPAHFTTFAYDALDRPVKVTAPDGTFRHNTYPSYFETRAFDAKSNESVVKRDVLDRTIRSANILDNKEIATTYSYGLLGLEDVIDSSNNRTHTEYNLLGLPTAQNTPDAGRTTVAYTGFGQVWQSIHQKSGATATSHYDVLGRVVNKESAEGSAVFSYDTAAFGLGQLAEAQSPDKVISRFGYDKASGRLTSMEQELDGLVDHVAMNYDSATGHLLSVDYPRVDGGLQPGLTVRYQYNPSAYVQKVLTQQPGQAAPQEIWNVTARNLDGALLTATQGWGGQMAIQRHYVPQSGRLDTTTVLQGNLAVLNLGYGYDANGLVQSREDKVVQRQEHFDYDSLLRLTNSALTYNGTQYNTKYTYDDLGNLLNVNGEQHLIGQAVPPLTSRESNVYGSNDPTFPQPHTLTSHTEAGMSDAFLYDKQGRRYQGGGLTTVFNSFDLPKTITKGGQTWSYTYDAFGTKAKETSPSGTSTTYVAGLYERRTAPGKDPVHVFHVVGTDGNVADIVYNAAQAQKYTPSYLLQDSLGSTSATIDGAGNIERRYYEAFGQRVNADGTSYAGPSSFVTSGFTGHEQEDALGLINMRGRLYDPKLKRFLTTDPYVTHPGFGQSWNPYSYVLNSPLNFTDPSGYALCEDLHEKPDTQGGIVCGTATVGGQSGSMAPGTDDFNHCRHCDENGSANGHVAYGGDLNREPIGPGFFDQGPRDGIPGSGDGRVGSASHKSYAGGYTGVYSAGGGGQADTVRKKICKSGAVFFNKGSSFYTGLESCGLGSSPGVGLLQRGQDLAEVLREKSKAFYIVIGFLKTRGFLVQVADMDEAGTTGRDNKTIIINLKSYYKTHSRELDVAFVLLHESVHLLYQPFLPTEDGVTGWDRIGRLYLHELVAYSIEWWAIAELVNAGVVPGGSDFWTDQALSFFDSVKQLNGPNPTSAQLTTVLNGVAVLATTEVDGSADGFYFFEYLDLLLRDLPK